MGACGKLQLGAQHAPPPVSRARSLSAGVSTGRPVVGPSYREAVTIAAAFEVAAAACNVAGMALVARRLVPKKPFLAYLLSVSSAAPSIRTPPMGMAARLAWKG